MWQTYEVIRNPHSSKARSLKLILFIKRLSNQDINVKICLILKFLLQRAG